MQKYGYRCCIFDENRNIYDEYRILINLNKDAAMHKKKPHNTHYQPPAQILVYEAVTSACTTLIHFDEILLKKGGVLRLNNENDGYMLAIFFVNEGELTWKAEENRQSGQIKAGLHNLWLVRQSDICFITNGSPTRLGYVLINPAIWAQFLPDGHIFKQQSANPKILIQLQFNTSSNLKLLFDELFFTSYTSDYVGKLLLQAKLLAIFGLQMQQYEQQLQHPTLSISDIEQMNKVKEIITSNIQQQYTIGNLAKMVGTNEQYLKIKFKTIYQTTVYQYMLQYKMEKAKSMLMHNNLTIGEIAQAVGYKHSTHFTHAFKKYFGHLPKVIKKPAG